MSLKDRVQTLRTVIEGFPAGSATPDRLKALRDTLHRQIEEAAGESVNAPRFDVVLMESRVVLIPLNDHAKLLLDDPVN
jgi:hypothetical protein